MGGVVGHVEATAGGIGEEEGGREIQGHAADLAIRSRAIARGFKKQGGERTGARGTIREKLSIVDLSHLNKPNFICKLLSAMCGNPFPD